MTNWKQIFSDNKNEGRKRERKITTQQKKRAKVMISQFTEKEN